MIYPYMLGKRMQFDAVHQYRPHLPVKSWSAYFTASFFIHLILIGTLVFFPSRNAFNHSRIKPPPSINVDLVAMNPEVPAPPAETVSDKGLPESGAPTAEPQNRPKPEAIAVKKAIKKEIRKKDYVLETPGPKIKTSLKQKTFSPEKVIENAVKRMADKSEKERPSSVQERIEQMKDQVGDLAYKSRLNGSLSDKTGKAPADDYSQMEIYQAEVAVLMKHNWAFSEEMAGSTRGLEARLVIKILPDGKITDIWYEKRSGNPYLDESAYKTVMKANPLPPLPEGYPYYHLVLGFTPSGLMR